MGGAQSQAKKKITELQRLLGERGTLSQRLHRSQTCRFTQMSRRCFCSNSRLIGRSAGLQSLETEEKQKRSRGGGIPKLDFLLLEPPPSCPSAQSEIWPCTAVTAHRWRWRSLTDGPICATDPGPPNIGATQMVQSTSRVSNWGGGLHSLISVRLRATLTRLTGG